ncbi:MAG TPA: hypothetical protein VM120_07475 [Bryobacteraceae bacterium]|nr:hypothetical protein [Bryobacteraceae bacterium]
MPEIPPEVKEFFRQQGARGGKTGGPARMASMTEEERSALGKKAVAARWAKAKKAAKKGK